MADELFHIRGDAPAAPDMKFWSIVGHEGFSRPSAYELTVLSEKKSIRPNDVLGYAFDVVIEFMDAGKARHQRHCQGHAVRFVRTRQVGRYQEYRVTLRSWFWLLTKRINARILQDKPVLEVIEDVLGDSPISRFKKLRKDFVLGTHAPHRYCVQFQESDYQFLSRLMEHEGIYYWFDSHDAPGTMHLSDASESAHPKLPAQATLEYHRSDRGEARFNEVIGWMAGQQFQPGKHASADSNFKTIRKKLDAKTASIEGHELPDFEVFEFPGDYFTSGDGETLERWRGEALKAGRERHWLTTPWPDVAVGKSFKYQGDPDASRNGEYIIAACTFVVVHPGYEGISDAQMARARRAVLHGMVQDDAFNAESIALVHDLIDGLPAFGEGGRGVRLFVASALPQSVTYRPPRLTPRVQMPGPQSAIVVGPEGEELHVDAFGRVKVHFHWDRYDASNEKSTCWVRVSQPWAGKGWGGYFAPRIGQEVVVDFLNGDPDRPIIMGRVYNDDQPIPYPSPTQSGFRTRSTPQGGSDNFNELRFEDQKGAEQVYLHAERNLDAVIEKRETRKVGASSYTKVGGEMQLSVGKKRTADIGTDDVLKVVADRSVTVGGKQQTIVGGTTTFVSFGDWTSAAPNINVMGVVSYTLTSITVTHVATALYSIATPVYQLTAPLINLSATTVVQNATVAQQITAGGALSLGAQLVAVSGTAGITLSCGPSSIAVSAAGVTITGPTITVNGEALIALTAPTIKNN